MKKFVVESLAKEINELHEGFQKQMAGKFKMLEELFTLAKEIGEFNEDKKTCS